MRISITLESGKMKNSVLLALVIASPIAASAQDAQTVDALKKELQELRQRTEQLEEKLKRLETAPARAPVSTNAPVIAATPPKDVATSATPSGFSPAAPITMFRTGNSYMNVSADALFAAGGSTARDIQNLQLG